MDIRKIKKLIELLEESGIAEIEIKEGEEALRISRMPAGTATGHQAAQVHVAALPAGADGAAATASAALPAAEKIGRASCRERVEISEGAVAWKEKSVSDTKRG